MNYYPHHIGDYLKGTAHLTMVEDGAYRRLLDLYYLHEQPLPAERSKVHRLSRAITAAEKGVVDTILDEYFVLTEDGWRHSRCDAELDAVKEKGEGAKDKRENEKERQKRHRERRSALFAQLREHGEVPAWDTPVTELESLLSQVLERDSNGTCNAPVTRTATAIHKPITNNQKKERLSSAGADLPAGFVEFWKEWPSTDRKTGKAECLKRWRSRRLEAEAEGIVTHVKAMKTTKQWLDGFEPAPLTYLNQRRWEDGAPPSLSLLTGNGADVPWEGGV